MSQNAGYLGLLDMFDGGGAGKAGAQFENGLFSGLLNGIGIKPIGFRDASDSGVDAVMEKWRGQTGAFGGASGRASAPAPSAPTVAPTALQPLSLSYGSPAAQIPGMSGTQLGYSKPAMPDLTALMQADQQRQQQQALDFALRNPSPAPSADTDKLSQLFQAAVRPGAGNIPTGRNVSRHPLAGLGF